MRTTATGKCHSQGPSKEADIDFLQQESSETEETGRTGARELVGGTLEGGRGGGCLGCDDGSHSGTDRSRCGARGGCGAGLRGGWGRGDGGGEWHDAAAGEGTLGHGDCLAGGGGVGSDRGGLGDGDGLAGCGGGVGDGA